MATLPQQLDRMFDDFVNAVPKNSVFKVNLTTSSEKLAAEQKQLVEEEEAEVQQADSLQEDVWDAEEELVA
ncbi:MAG: hypothetical protein WA865_11405 [Spirulinaceae cyanobacterium]